MRTQTDRWLAACRVALVAVAFASSACGAPMARSGGGERGASPEFVLSDLDGRTVRLSDYQGKVVLVTFWATWCAPCAAEHPQLEKLWREYRDEGFVVLGVSMDGPETVSGVASLASSRGLTVPILLDEDTRAAAVLNPRGAAPYSVLIDREGQIAWTHDGYHSGDELALEAELRRRL